MRYEDENIWLTQKMMATLYDVDVCTINEHIKKIYSDSELEEDSRVCEKTKVFSCVLFLINTTVIIFHKKAYNPPSPMRMPL